MRTGSKMRGEVPDLKRKPSEYMRTNLWYATQPVEEPEHPDDLRQVFEWIGWDRMVYSSATIRTGTSTIRTSRGGSR